MLSRYSLLTLAVLSLCMLCLWQRTSTTQNLVAHGMREFKRLATAEDDSTVSTIKNSGQMAVTIHTVNEKSVSKHVVNSTLPKDYMRGNSTHVVNDSSNSTAPTNSSNYPTHPNQTIIVSLHGEMGNHLCVLARALAVQQQAQEEYGIQANFVLRHSRGQPKRKWKRSRNNIQKCFPMLRSYNFTEANSQEFASLEEAQNQQLKELGLSKLSDDDKESEFFNRSLSVWNDLLESNIMNTTSVGAVAVPFFEVSKFPSMKLFDQYLNVIRSFLAFDNEACCLALPDADESVFHLRNFMVEFPRRKNFARKKGFEELSPNKTANELFAHLKPGDKVAITTRFGGKHVEPYVSALEQRGLRVRVIRGQSGVQDFCFLLNAKKELVGTKKSTFLELAALLGDMERAELYDMQDPKKKKDDSSYPTFTHPVLKKRIVIKAYNSEKQDEVEAQA